MALGDVLLQFIGVTDKNKFRGRRGLQRVGVNEDDRGNWFDADFAQDNFERDMNATQAAPQDKPGKPASAIKIAQHNHQNEQNGRNAQAGRTAAVATKGGGIHRVITL